MKKNLPDSGQKHPNIVMITCDQLRKDALGCYGNEKIKTPHIDRLAKRGILFNYAFVASPVCSPNRGSIATGRYPSVHGLRFNGMELPQTETTLMDELHSNGYLTCGVGKMHFSPQWNLEASRADPSPECAINPQPEQFPWYGFEQTMITEDNRVGPYAEYMKKQGLNIWTDLHSFSYPQHACACSTYPAEHHQTNWIADRSIEMIKNRDLGKPLFLWTSFVHPHHPFNPPAPYDKMYNPDDMPLPKFDENEVDRWPRKYREKYEAVTGTHEAIGMNRLGDEDWKKIKAYYYGMINCIDDAIGRMLKVIDNELGLDNTIVLFTADHGEMLGDHHLMFKSTMYDEVTRIPLIAAGPGIKHNICESLVSSIDILPSLLDCAGLTIPDAVQGQSFTKAFTGLPANTRDSMLIESPEGRRTLWKKEARISWHNRADRGELYDHQKDPECFKNLWDTQEAQSLQKELMGELVDQIIQNVDPLPQRIGMC